MVAGGLWLYGRAASGMELWSGLLVGAVLLLVVVTDVEHRLILHAVTGPSALLVIALAALDPSRGLTKSLLGGVAGFGLVLALYLLGLLFSRALSRLRGREVDEVAFGFGDVTLAGVLGLAVGWPGILVALLLGIFAAGAFSGAVVLSMVLRRRYSPFTAIPYGPFLVLGAAIVYYGGRTALERLLAG